MLPVRRAPWPKTPCCPWPRLRPSSEHTPSPCAAGSQAAGCAAFAPAAHRPGVAPPNPTCIRPSLPPPARPTLSAHRGEVAGTAQSGGRPEERLLRQVPRGSLGEVAGGARRSATRHTCADRTRERTAVHGTLAEGCRTTACPGQYLRPLQ